MKCFMDNVGATLLHSNSGATFNFHASSTSVQDFRNSHCAACLRIRVAANVRDKFCTRHGSRGALSRIAFQSLFRVCERVAAYIIRTL